MFSNLYDFWNIAVSQVNAATSVRYGGLYNTYFVENFVPSLSVKESWKSINFSLSYRRKYGVLFFWLLVYIDWLIDYWLIYLLDRLRIYTVIYLLFCVCCEVLLRTKARQWWCCLDVDARHLHRCRQPVSPSNRRRLSSSPVVLRNFRLTCSRLLTTTWRTATPSTWTSDRRASQRRSLGQRSRRWQSQPSNKSRSVTWTQHWDGGSSVRRSPRLTSERPTVRPMKCSWHTATHNSPFLP